MISSEETLALHSMAITIALLVALIAKAARRDKNNATAERMLDTLYHLGVGERRK